MLEQLIESTSHRRDNRSRTGFFLVTSALVLTLGLSFFVWSMFAMSLNLTDEGLELSTLIAPVTIPAAEPPKPEPVQPQQQQQQASKSEVSSRRELMASVDETQDPPKDISVTPNTQKARPIGVPVRISNGPETDVSSSGPNRGDGTTGGGPGIVIPGTVAGGGNNNTGNEEPPAMKKKEPEVKRDPPVKSGGVLNGQATYLPKPPYPPHARLLNISDSVNVQVVIDERGNVISAKAVSGHQTLRDAAERAARGAKFGPTYLTGQPVKVTGVIIYKFAG